MRNNNKKIERDMIMSQQPTVLVVGHSRNASLRRLGDWFAERGLAHEMRFGGDGLPDSLDGYAGMVVLGGAPLPYEDDKFPWLPATRALARQAIDEDRPYLGLCLGGQLLAYTAGGTVEHRVLKPEHGMIEITALPAAAEDPLFSVLPEHFWMTEFHQDHITALPEGAIRLAETDRTPVQGFRLGTCQWGLQFHPEAAYANILDWDADDQAACERDGGPWSELVATAKAHDAENTSEAHAFATRFADLVLGTVR